MRMDWRSCVIRLGTSTSLYFGRDATQFLGPQFLWSHAPSHLQTSTCKIIYKYLWFRTHKFNVSMLHTNTDSYLDVLYIYLFILYINIHTYIVSHIYNIYIYILYIIYIPIFSWSQWSRQGQQKWHTALRARRCSESRAEHAKLVALMKLDTEWVDPEQKKGCLLKYSIFMLQKISIDFMYSDDSYWTDCPRPDNYDGQKKPGNSMSIGPLES
jgi:hypothetical protein